ncbi:MAG: hypothetical protein ACK4S2_00230 [Gemmobacter sp.]|uniref:hypothetical protein n=1 Tax=Gemmobacter sp. TaxID=1898957 RepID=UPI003919D5A5
MQVLIVEADPDRARSWAAAPGGQGWTVRLASTNRTAIALMDAEAFRVIVLSLDLADGKVPSVPVYAGYRQPEAKIIVVTATGMFHDGSIFQLCSNACTIPGTSAKPADLAARVDNHGNRPVPVRSAAPGANAVH